MLIRNQANHNLKQPYKRRQDVHADQIKHGILQFRRPAEEQLDHPFYYSKSEKKNLEKPSSINQGRFVDELVNAGTKSH